MKQSQQQGERKRAQLEEIGEDMIAINYSVHMHPITQLTIPDFMEQDKTSMIDTTCTILYAMLPMALNFILNFASALINIYTFGTLNDKNIFAEVCLGTVIANILAYNLIEYIGSGFSIICSYFQQKQEVGFLYQKTLGISFLICVIVTPLTYLTDRFLKFLQFDFHLVTNACTYAWALVPSFYLYAFIDTNKNYLHSQGVIFPPILIHFAAILVHVIICVFLTSYSHINFLTVGWTKNITDLFCCFALYFYIINKQPTKESWVQWNIKATNNIVRFLKQVMFHEAFTYFQVIAFQILSLLSCYLSAQQMAAHFSFAFIYLILYFCFNSLSQCLNKAVALSIEQNEIKICKKTISLGFLLTILISFLVVVNIVQHRAIFSEIFISDPDVMQVMKEVVVVFCLVLVCEGLNIITTGLVKALELEDIWKYSFCIYYIVGLGCSAYLCFEKGYGVKGLWLGWLVSVLISLLLHLKQIICLDFQETFQMMRDRYKMIKQQIRLSRLQIAQQARKK